MNKISIMSLFTYFEKVFVFGRLLHRTTIHLHQLKKVLQSLVFFWFMEMRSSTPNKGYVVHTGSLSLCPIIGMPTKSRGARSHGMRAFTPDNLRERIPACSLKESLQVTPCRRTSFVHVDRHHSMTDLEKRERASSSSSLLSFLSTDTAHNCV